MITPSHIATRWDATATAVSLCALALIAALATALNALIVWSGGTP
jgi:hypothetical protein